MAILNYEQSFQTPVMSQVHMMAYLYKLDSVFMKIKW